MKTLGILAIAFVFYLVGAWGVNIIKLTNCDFVAPYKCEAIHGLGVLPPVAMFTAWIDVEETK